MSADPPWMKIALGAIANVTMGQSPLSSSYNEDGVGIPLVQGNADIKERQTVDRLWTSQPTKRCRAGDVILTVRAPVGHVAVASNDLCLGRGVCSLAAGADNPFLFHALIHAEREWAVYEQGSTFTAVNSSEVRGFEIGWPSDPDERKAIASALDNASDLIGALERLTAKKRAIRKGISHQLLTGKTRLPGFEGSWDEAEVGDLLAFKNGLNKGSEYFGAGTPIVNFMDVMSGPIITAAEVTGQVTLTRDEIKRFSAKRGDLFFTRTSETVEEIGTAATLVDDIPDAVFSGFILRGRPKTDEMDQRFLAHLFQLPDVRRQVTSLATYTTRALTNGGSLGRVLVRLPDPREQSAIADVIADFDREIATLRRRTEKAHRMKTGMMQELLTGRTRLPATEFVA